MMSCAQHDYIEIACLYLLKVELTLEGGLVLRGRAQDTLFDSNKVECMKILLDDNECATVVLSELVSMRALVLNPHFDVVIF
jgi:Rho-binding antiterminator